jgi:hypothetical protein
VILPNAHLAVVEQQKIREYLLNPAHPDNGGKARFFTAVGFTSAAWEQLADALREMARTVAVTIRTDSIHGEKFVLEGELRAPSGIAPRVRSVWIIDRGSQAPRLVTAYPCA